MWRKWESNSPQKSCKDSSPALEHAPPIMPVLTCFSGCHESACISLSKCSYVEPDVHLLLFIVVAPARVELARPLLTNRFSYHTCFYTSRLSTMLSILLVQHLFSKSLWSGLFYYHIRNLARYSFIFSFSYCKLSEIKSLLLHNLDSTIISNLGISSIVSTHLWGLLRSFN